LTGSLLRVVAFAVPVAALGLVACASKPAPQVQPPATPSPPADLVVLLADPDGTVGAADVSNAQGSTALEARYHATRVAAGAAPGAAEELGENDIQRLFGDTLNAMPPPPQHFTLYFRFESEELTAESRASIPRILESVKRHPAPEVLVVGHTDTTGPAERNLKLGLRRAMTVRELLIASDLDRSTIEVTSHGEADLLIKTADDVFEARNRRVDITVR
jgi:outer membrane protein OmpA-like peptidoglycan-associated protein